MNLSQQVWKKHCQSHTLMCFNLPLKAIMVMMFGWCKTKGIQMSFTKFPHPFTKHSCCICKWALCNNLCKHQVFVLLTCTNLDKGNIIEYCGTWYQTNCGGFKAIFMNPTYLQFGDGYLKDEDQNEDHGEKVSASDIKGFTAMDDNGFNNAYEGVKIHI